MLFPRPQLRRNRNSDRCNNNNDDDEHHIPESKHDSSLNLQRYDEIIENFIVARGFLLLLVSSTFVFLLI